MIRILYVSCCVSVLVILSVGCADRRTVPLDEALRKTGQGEYSLIAVADDLISFQVDSRHKYQCYASANDIATAVPLVYDALSVASNAGHRVIFMDARNTGKSNTPLQATSQ